jgi:hypothetical protein
VVAVFSSGLGEGGFAQMEAERLAMQRQSMAGIPTLYSSYQTTLDIGRGSFQVLDAERLLRQIPQGYAYQAEDIDIPLAGEILGLEPYQLMGIAGVVGLVAGYIVGRATK